QEGVGHVAQHRESMLARAVQLSQSMAVTHDRSLLSVSPPHGARGESKAYGRSRFAGGQFSSFMPRLRPRDASTSLISLSDLRPRFGVFSSSVSVRWMRSPM